MNIITFCASHLTTQERVNLLKGAIASILNQKYKVCLYISLSFESDELKKPIAELLAEYTGSEYVKMFIHPYVRLSQFEHYNFLLQQIDAMFYNRMWVMFMDDDDYSEPFRSRIFSSSIQTAERECQSIWNPYVLHFKNKDNLEPTHKNCTIALMKGTDTTRVVSSCEYVTFCIRLGTLNKFLHIMKRHDLLHTALCDVVLSSVLHNITVKWTRASMWVYAYNCHSGNDRMTNKFSTDYYKKTYKTELFKDLAQEFRIDNWDVAPGYSPVFPQQSFMQRGFFKSIIGWLTHRVQDGLPISRSFFAHLAALKLRELRSGIAHIATLKLKELRSLRLDPSTAEAQT